MAVDLDLAGEPINASDAGARDLRTREFGHPDGPWDRVAFNGTRFAGAAEVKLKKQRRNRKRATPGRRGVRMVDTGTKPCEVTITLTAWLQNDGDGKNHFKQLFELVNNILIPSANTVASARGADPSAAAAVAIDHPATRWQGVEAIYVDEIEGPEPGQAQGSLVCRIRATQFIPDTQRAAARGGGSRVPKLDHPVDAVVLPRGVQDQHAQTTQAARPPSQTNTGP